MTEIDFGSSSQYDRNRIWIIGHEFIGGGQSCFSRGQEAKEISSVFSSYLWCLGMIPKDWEMV